MIKRCVTIISLLTAALAGIAVFFCSGGTAYAQDTVRRAHIEIEANGKIFTYDDEEIIPSDFTVAEDIERRGINLSLEKKTEIIDEYLRGGADYKTAISVCFPRLITFINDIADTLYIPAKDSEVVYSGGVFRATDEVIGRRLDENSLYCSVYYTLRYGTNERIKASTVKIYPNIKKNELLSTLVLRGQYTTNYASSTSMRADNIILALSKIDGMRIESGGVMSFNAVVGERTVENGYKTAKIISDGKYVDGVGGGVCQASTAVYNAALRAGLKCIANAHSICPSYCAPGLDAMISSVSDLVIYNNTDSAVYISAAADRKSATVKFFGVKNEFDKIVPESEVVAVEKYGETETVDYEHKYFSYDTPSGDRLLIAPGRDGYKSETYLCYYVNGILTKRDRIRANTYKSSPQIVAIAP
ncbi:MAG: VanW family protein [Clostridiales bacterium]|nr:VanW family protein [Clostridiales bacterium]